MKDSKIEWTHHTWNPWRGCTKVSPGCAHCYAEKGSVRNPAVLGVWGPRGTRVIAAESSWEQPLTWDRAAKRAGERHRVFCASLSDVFEGDETMPAEARPAVHAARERLWSLIEQTSNLDWLLLTKRPENVNRMIAAGTGRHADAWLTNHPHVWIGTSAEDQRRADERIPYLLKVPARVRFLSCEPVLGPINLSRWLVCERCGGEGTVRAVLRTSAANCIERMMPCPSCNGRIWRRDIHWVICGGESGPKARPMHPEWARSLRDQCVDAGVPYFFKQWGEYEPYEETAQPPFWRDQHGREYDGHWLDIINPETGSVGRGWHEDSLHSSAAFRRVGKARAGRLLDGREWNEFPSVEVL